LGTFWLKIEQFWPFEEISIFNNGGHLGYRTALTDTNLNMKRAFQALILKLKILKSTYHFGNRVKS
jgi:hypothetical protein